MKTLSKIKRLAWNQSLKNTLRYTFGLLTIFIASNCTQDVLDIDLGQPVVESTSTNITTGGHVVYHLQKANTTGGNNSIAAATFDGTVLCYSDSGSLLWSQLINANFPFDIDVADIDGDGLDEVFVAKAGGVVEAFDDDGTLLWEHTIDSQTNIYQVCAAKSADDKWRLYFGGIEEQLYVFSAVEGVQEAKIFATDVVRLLCLANYDSADYQSLIVTTQQYGLGGKIAIKSIALNNTETPTAFTRESAVFSSGDYSGRVYSVLPLDKDGNGLDELYYSGDYGSIRMFDQTPTGQFYQEDAALIMYRMTFLHDVTLEEQQYILGQYGGYILLFDVDGNLLETITSDRDYTNSYYDADSTTLYLGSSSSGGDAIYSIDLSDPDWRTLFAENEYTGTMADVESNLAELEEQVSNYMMPPYQPTQPEITIMGNSHTVTDYSNVSFVENAKYYQVYTEEEAATETWCQTIDTRYTYDDTVAEIIAAVKALETKHTYFNVFISHGSGMYMSLDTMKAIVDAAPNYLVGFILTEMEGIDDKMEKAITEIVAPLADYCKPYGKKLIFWQKNIFWAGTCYYNFWYDFLFDDQYYDIIIPALEETNSRTQEIALAGNIGLWVANRYNQWSCRIQSDNTSFDRMWEWSSQQSPSYYYREAALNASYGAEVFFTDVNQGELSTYVKDQLTSLHSLLSKGVIHIPESSKDIYSMSPIALGMRTPPSENYIAGGTNSHNYNYTYNNYLTSNQEMIFSRMDEYWGAAPILDYDFSKYGYGCERRHLNFLPQIPYGMVPILPLATDITDTPIEEVVDIDGEYFYINGTATSASAYQSTMERRLQDASDDMKISIDGDVAWSAVKLDDTHMRVLLVDPGYVDPATRTVTVTIQGGFEAEHAFNILTQEVYNIKNSSFTVTVPAGIFSAIDVIHSN